MSYRRRYNAKPKRYNKKYKKPMPYRQEKATKAIVRKELDKSIENKYVFANGANAIGTGLSVYNMTSNTTISAGTGRSQRVGNMITVKSVTIRGKIVLAAADALSRIRIMIVRTTSSGYTPILSDLVYYDTSTYQIQSPPNYVEMKGKYQILYDKRFVLDEVNGDSKDWYFHKKINKKCWYDDAGNTLKGHIWLCHFADDGTYNITNTWGSYLSFEDA